jgi:3-phenylpropionate/cinnamic acid dioxygenase small subunit
MQTLEERIQQLWDIAAIQDLRNKFGEALDNKNWDLFGKLFADEVLTDWTAWGVPKQTMKKEDIVTMFSQGAFRRPELITEHLYTNFRITVDGDQATCVSNFLGQHFIPDFEGGSEFYLRGEYTDNLIRTIGGWAISSLRLRVFYTSGNPKLLA